MILKLEINMTHLSKPRIAQRMMERCQKDTETSLKGISLAKSRVI